MKQTFVISPWSRALRNGKQNPKNYPWWNNLVMLLNGSGAETIQIGISGEPSINCMRQACDLSFADLYDITKNATSWISVDNFFPHFCHYHKLPGVVLWGKSDPNIFGYPENLNILKDHSYLRQQQFGMWENEQHDANAFVDAQTVFHVLQEKFPISSIMAFDLNQL